MKITLIIISVLIIFVIVFLFIKGINSRTGVAPGIVDGMLSQCPNKPNCVCSERAEESAHYIEPVIISPDNAADLIPLIKSIITEMGGVLQSENEYYLAYHFTSAIFGFVDDFEIRIDSKQKLIHFRSASRVGTSDLGVNKNRVELLKKLYKEKVLTTI